MKDSMGWAPPPAGPEPQLSPDFASQAIAKADQIRARQRRTKIALRATAAAALAILFWMRPVAENQNTPTQASSAQSNESVSASSTELSYASSEEDSDLLTVMMPDARQAEKFDTDYGPAAWTAYAAWNPVSYDSYR